MLTKYVLPLLALAGLAFAVFTVVQAQQKPPSSRPIASPPVRPIGSDWIAGAGIIEAQRRNIPIGTPVAGVVETVFVKEGSIVKAGDPLFKIDARELIADRNVRRAMREAAEAELARLEAGYRSEDREIAAASLKAAQARYNSAEVQYRRTVGIFERGAGTQSEYDRDRFALDEAYAALLRARTEAEKLQNGSWIEDIKVARANVAQARMEEQRLDTEIERRTILAPMDGQILQVNVLPGQFAALAWNEPLLLLGDVTSLHVRVDIDEQDLPFFTDGAEAVATLKNRAGVKFELKFVRVDPYVIPKKSLTGNNTERVDTRVLQVIYALPDERPIAVHVGQQMDVYLKATRVPGLDLDVSSLPPSPPGSSDAASPAPAGTADEPREGFPASSPHSDGGRGKIDALSGSPGS
jgi:multidrug resistance efflux pump